MSRHAPSVLLTLKTEGGLDNETTAVSESSGS